MSKTIQINPDLFNISKSTTRKKSALPKPPKIELKSSVKTQKQKTLRKNVLKMIREKQQEAYRELFDTKKKSTSLPPIDKKTDFDNSFDNSLKFFSNLANKVETEPNATLKNYNAIQTTPIAPIISISPNIPPLSNVTDSFDNIQLPPLPSFSAPKYGCLKNGTLPTFRTYTRIYYTGGSPPTTQINDSFITPRIGQSPISSSLGQSPISPFTGQSPISPFTGQSPISSSLGQSPISPFTGQSPISPSFGQHGGSLEINMDDPFDKPLLTNGGSNLFTPKFIEESQKFDKIHKGKIQPSNAERKIRYKKRKKIFKRTYRIGRSKTEPKVGVLVSNKTIRNRITTEAQLLKQTPIQDVRRFLIKKGFIKVGTNAPNDVLRKMYETVSLVCGEIQNHNPENLLYNFMNDKE